MKAIRRVHRAGAGEVADGGCAVQEAAANAKESPGGNVDAGSAVFAINATQDKLAALNINDTGERINAGQVNAVGASLDNVSGAGEIVGDSKGAGAVELERAAGADVDSARLQAAAGSARAKLQRAGLNISCPGVGVVAGKNQRTVTILTAVSNNMSNTGEKNRIALPIFFCEA